MTIRFATWYHIMVSAAENKIQITNLFITDRNYVRNLHGDEIPMISFSSLVSTVSFPHLSHIL